MMYITHTDISIGTKTWHVGKKMPDDYIHLIEFVQAHGDELQEIYRQFAHLPQARLAKVVRWYGDHAKFIVANLKE